MGSIFYFRLFVTYLYHGKLHNCSEIPEYFPAISYTFTAYFLWKKKIRESLLIKNKPRRMMIKIKSLNKMLLKFVSWKEFLVVHIKSFKSFKSFWWHSLILKPFWKCSFPAFRTQIASAGHNWRVEYLICWRLEKYFYF